MEKSKMTLDEIKSICKKHNIYSRTRYYELYSRVGLPYLPYVNNKEEWDEKGDWSYILCKVNPRPVSPIPISRPRSIKGKEFLTIYELFKEVREKNIKSLPEYKMYSGMIESWPKDPVNIYKNLWPGANIFFNEPVRKFYNYQTSLVRDAARKQNI